MIKNQVKEALNEFFESKEGQKLIVKAVKTAMIYELNLEKHHKDDTIERVKENGDILTYIAGWISKSEGAIRGCQQDVEKTSTRILQVRNAFGEFLERISYGPDKNRKQIR